MVGFRISIYDATNPQDIWKLLKPLNCINTAWISQTIGDQVWMWFEFANESDKSNYINSLKPFMIHLEWHEAMNGKLRDKSEDKIFDPIEYFMHNEGWMTQEEIDHWTK